jgi:hypothetical protein
LQQRLYRRRAANIGKNSVEREDLTGLKNVRVIQFNEFVYSFGPVIIHSAAKISFKYYPDCIHRHSTFIYVQRGTETLSEN